MGELWKNGDVITAEKLNRMIFVNVTQEIDGSTVILRTDITPADIFDENNYAIGWIVFVMKMARSNNVTTEYVIVRAASYLPDEQTKYLIDACLVGESSSMTFSAASSDDFFTASITKDEGIR